MMTPNSNTRNPYELTLESMCRNALGIPVENVRISEQWNREPDLVTGRFSVHERIFRDAKYSEGNEHWHSPMLEFWVNGERFFAYIPVRVTKRTTSGPFYESHYHEINGDAMFKYAVKMIQDTWEYLNEGKKIPKGGIEGISVKQVEKDRIFDSMRT